MACKRKQFKVNFSQSSFTDKFKVTTQRQTNIWEIRITTGHISFNIINNVSFKFATDFFYGIDVTNLQTYVWLSGISCHTATRMSEKLTSFNRKYLVQNHYSKVFKVFPSYFFAVTALWHRRTKRLVLL